MIYTRWGGTVEIVANYGEVVSSELVAPATLVQVKFEDGAIRFRFAEFLKADEGWQEIHAALEALPISSISGKDKKSAIGEAL